MPKTLKELCAEAVNVQDACNLSGVVHAFSRAMTNLRELFPDQNTQFYNTHPIAILFSSKISSLTDSENALTFSKAYDYCSSLLK